MLESIGKGFLVVWPQQHTRLYICVCVYWPFNKCICIYEYTVIHIATNRLINFRPGFYCFLKLRLSNKFAAHTHWVYIRCIIDVEVEKSKHQIRSTVDWWGREVIRMLMWHSWALWCDAFKWKQKYKWDAYLRGLQLSQKQNTKNVNCWDFPWNFCRYLGASA